MVNKHLFSILLLSLPLGAKAGTFTPPQGCTPEMTVQMLGCTVSNHYRCAADTPGDQWRAEFGQNGLFFQSRINSEAEWMESFNYNPDSHETLEQPQADPASFSELLANGEDTYEFSTLSDAGVRENVSGFDRLTGETMVIDGVVLKQTQYDATAVHDDGTPAWHTRGHEFIDPARRTFLSGRGEWQGADGADFLPFDASPISFAFPGDAGFMSTTPLFGCDEVLSLSDAPTLISAGKGE